MPLFKYNGFDPETKVLMRWMESRFKKNKTVTIFVTGNLGTGKSYTSIEIGELWYRYHFNKHFPCENIFFNIEEAMKAFVSGRLQRGELIVLEEVGISLNSKNFQGKVNKFFNYYMQSFRQKQIFVVFNCPVFSLLDKSTRILINANFITQGIDHNKKKTIVKPLFLQLNQHTGKVYNKYLKVNTSNIKGYNIRRKVKRMGFQMPPKDTLMKYELKKEEFVTNLGKNVLSEVIVKNKEIKPLTEFQERLFKYIKENPKQTLKSYSEHFNRNAGTIFHNLEFMRHKGHNVDVYLRKRGDLS